MDIEKIEKQLESVNAYFIGVSIDNGEGFDFQIQIDGSGVIQMLMLARLVKLIGDSVGKTQDEVLDDLRDLIHDAKTEGEENEQ